MYMYDADNVMGSPGFPLPMEDSFTDEMLHELALSFTCRGSFFGLCDKLVRLDVAIAGTYKKQENAIVQLAITIDSLGHFGNGMALTRLGEY
ncbi:hypothetical protein BGX28_010186 [Mortierella sp. GBA30]|nr:hypothetical protein BGX28_010186 [Mortierella sp. GBA30]